MGEKQVFQPLTKEDKVTVVLYRIGIVLAAVFVSCLAYLLTTGSFFGRTTDLGMIADILGYGLYAAVGLSVFFIHLYIGQFKAYLKKLYFIGLACLAMLLFLGSGSPANAIAANPVRLLLLLPLAGCLGFVTAKEAFCFKLLEGYLLAMIMPLYLLLVASGSINNQGTTSGLVVIAAMLAFFTLRKVFMPLAYDIGDKTAYR